MATRQPRKLSLLDTLAQDIHRTDDLTPRALVIRPAVRDPGMILDTRAEATSPDPALDGSEKSSTLTETLQRNG